ncbi:MAG: hypothetical protein ACR2PM_01315, partial [Hyphomicrobiales bacterium]
MRPSTRHRKRIRAKAIAAAILFLIAGTAALADALEDGVAAYQKGDFATAAGLWKQSADEGNAAAQN